MLTSKEGNILKCLMRHPEFIKTRNQIIDAAWGEAANPNDRCVDSCIKRIRRKCEKKFGSFECIEACKGIGYVFRGDVKIIEREL